MREELMHTTDQPTHFRGDLGLYSSKLPEGPTKKEKPDISNQKGISLI